MVDMPDNYFKIKMYEDEWVLYLIEDDDTVIASETASAETNFETKEIYFRKGHLTLATVRHEIWHVALGYCYISDTHEITLVDMEEINAAVFADRGPRLIQLSETIYKQLIEMRGT